MTLILIYIILEFNFIQFIVLVKEDHNHQIIKINERNEKQERLISQIRNKSVSNKYNYQTKFLNRVNNNSIVLSYYAIKYFYKCQDKLNLIEEHEEIACFNNPYNITQILNTK
jgi:hypothetical protein